MVAIRDWLIMEDLTRQVTDAYFVLLPIAIVGCSIGQATRYRQING
jgi:hypothetical protein